MKKHISMYLFGLMALLVSACSNGDATGGQTAQVAAKRPLKRAPRHQPQRLTAKALFVLLSQCAHPMRIKSKSWKFFGTAVATVLTSSLW